MKRMMRGYAVAEVDAFLSRCAATPGVLAAVPALSTYAPAGSPVTAAEVTDAVFSVQLRGYDQREVDDTLDEVVAALS